MEMEGNEKTLEENRDGRNLRLSTEEGSTMFSVRVRVCVCFWMDGRDEELGSRLEVCLDMVRTGQELAYS